MLIEYDIWPVDMFHSTEFMHTIDSLHVANAIIIYVDTAEPKVDPHCFSVHLCILYVSTQHLNAYRVSNRSVNVNCHLQLSLLM